MHIHTGIRLHTAALFNLNAFAELLHVRLGPQKKIYEINAVILETGYPLPLPLFNQT